jgi:hypothetical protein
MYALNRVKQCPTSFVILLDWGQPNRWPFFV